jgi:hypothetical protein
VKYRWLDAEQPVRYHGPAPDLRGQIGAVVLLPARVERQEDPELRRTYRRPLGNILVDFSGRLVVVPFGCLRNVS